MQVREQICTHRVETFTAAKRYGVLVKIDAASFDAGCPEHGQHLSPAATNVQHGGVLVESRGVHLLTLLDGCLRSTEFLRKLQPIDSDKFRSRLSGPRLRLSLR